MFKFSFLQPSVPAEIDYDRHRRHHTFYIFKVIVIIFIDVISDNVLFTFANIVNNSNDNNVVKHLINHLNIKLRTLHTL
jgi:hypothetical protein